MFAIEIDRAVERLRESPLRWPTYLHGTRRARLRRFPFALVYRLGADGTPNMPRMQRVGERGPAAADDWYGLRRREAYAVRATESTTLLPGVVGMLLACAFMMLAWRREGR